MIDITPKTSMGDMDFRRKLLPLNTEAKSKMKIANPIGYIDFRGIILLVSNPGPYKYNFFEFKTGLKLFAPAMDSRFDNFETVFNKQLVDYGGLKGIRKRIKEAACDNPVPDYSKYRFRTT